MKRFANTLLLLALILCFAAGTVFVGIRFAAADGVPPIGPLTGSFTFPGPGTVPTVSCDSTAQTCTVGTSLAGTANGDVEVGLYFYPKSTYDAGGTQDFDSGGHFTVDVASGQTYPANIQLPFSSLTSLMNSMQAPNREYYVAFYNSANTAYLSNKVYFDFGPYVGSQPSSQWTLAASGQTAGSQAGSYVENFGVMPTTATTTSTTATLKVTDASSGALLQNGSVTIPAGAGATTISTENLEAGSYNATLVVGGSAASPAVPFTITTGSGGSSADDTLTETGQAAGVTSGTYAGDFSVTPESAETSSTTLSLEVFDSTGTVVQTTTVTVPAGGTTPISVSINSLSPGSYTAALYDGTTVVSAVVPFTITGSTGSGSGTGTGTGNVPLPPVVTGGVSIAFPSNLQVVTGTSATINGIVSVSLPLTVSLNFLYSPVGQPLSNSQQVLPSTQLYPGTKRSITFTYSGLTPGVTYQFAVKNNTSNKVSSPIVFTTPGGAMNQTAVFDGVAVGSNGNPNNTTFSDSISNTGIVPRCGLTHGPNTTPQQEQMCGYTDFLQLISNVIQYLLIIIGPIVAILAMFAGFMIIWYGKMPDMTGQAARKIEEYKQLFIRVFIGLVIILIAFVLISTIIRELGVKPNYTLLDIVGL